MADNSNKEILVNKPATHVSNETSLLNVVEQEYIDDDNKEEASDRYPKSNRILTAITLNVMGIGVYVFNKLLTMSNEVLSVPYRYVLEFYNITLLAPIQTFPKLWAWLTNLELTSNSDVNLVVAAIVMFLYWMVVFGAYSLWVEFVGILIARLGNYNRPDVIGAFELYLLPALLATLFFLIVNVFLLYGDNGVF